MKYLPVFIVIGLIVIGLFLVKTPPKKPATEAGDNLNEEKNTPAKTPVGVGKTVDADVTIHKDPISDTPENLEIKAKLNDIIIEHMEFEDASIPAVIKALQFEAKQADPEKKGINIILLQDQGKNKAVAIEDKLSDEEDFLLDNEDMQEPEREVESEISLGKTITIMFDDLSLGEAIRNICIAAELKFRIEKYALVIADKNVPLDEFETRIYPVDCESDFGGEAPGDGGAVSVQGFFKRQGVHFSNGSSIVYDNAISRIIATNTPYELKRIEQIIDDLNVVDPQVLITTRFVKIPDREFRKLKGTKKLSVWEQVIRSDKTEILASASMVTQNGEEGTVRMIREVYFPDYWGKCGFSSTSETETADNDSDENSDDEEESADDKSELEEKTVPLNGQVISYSSMPEFGEPTELGTSLCATPNVDLDKYTITLDMIPVIQYFSGWTKYEKNVKMPIIKAWTVITQVTLYDGDTIPLGFALEDVGEKSKRERNRFMMLVTATLINPDGTPLRNKAGVLNPIPKKKRRNAVKTKKTVLKKPKTIMEQIVMDDAEIANLVDFLNMQIKKKENFNIVLAIDEAELSSIPTVTLNLKNIPYYELIRYICKMTGLKYRLDGNTITIGKSVADMEAQFFKIRSALICRICPSNSSGSDDGDFEDSIAGSENIDESGQGLKTFLSMQGVFLPKGSHVTYDPKTGRYTVDSRNTRFEDYERPSKRDQNQALRNYFRERGISFPPGSYITYNRRSGKLLMFNTPENLRRLGNLLRDLDIEQPQVLVEMTILEINNQDLIGVIGKKAALSDNLSEAQINKIIDSEKGRILLSQMLIAKNGEDANVRLVNETYYPDTWTSPEISPVEGYLQETSPCPEFSELTDLGSSLTLTPNVSPDNYTISLALSPQFIDFQGWTHYPQSYKIEGNGKVRTGKTDMTMAEIGRKDLNVNMKINDGGTIMVSRAQQIDISDKKNKSFDYVKSWTEMLRDAKSNGEELKNVFFFIKANIINPDGEFVR